MEHIETEENFIRLFSPNVLDILDPNSIWNKPQIIRSAPGGGKSSLLRLFTPRALLTVYNLRIKDNIKDLFSRLCFLDAISDNGPRVLGIFLSCANVFDTLEDLDIDSVKKQRLFFSLLNARILISALRGALFLKGYTFPDDLIRLQISDNNIGFETQKFTLPCNGQQLYEWASSIEKNVCDAVNSFDPVIDSTLMGDDSLFSLRLITSQSLLIEEKPVMTHVVLILDDVHKLTTKQREYVYNKIKDSRIPNIWIAERLEALEPKELFLYGSTNTRDYDILYIEEIWRDSKNSKRFEKLLSDIGDRRAKNAKDREINSFEAYLQDSLDGTEWEEKFRTGATTVSERVRKKAESTQRYQDWILEAEKFNGLEREKAIKWRMLEVLIERDQRRIQKSLFDLTISSKDMPPPDSSVRVAAELFFCQEFKIPYYYGFSQIASLSSLNIEQFLTFAGDLFEEIISNTLLKKTSNLIPKRQEAILEKIAENKWKDILQQVKHGSDVRNFLESIGKFAREETFRPNAPYAPGVTGIAISMRDRDLLIDTKETQKTPDYSKLATIISSCIANNLLEVRIDYSQNNKRWMVMYLNRILCLQFGLPFQYGGWKEKSLKDLVMWFKKVYSPQPKPQEMFS